MSKKQKVVKNKSKLPVPPANDAVVSFDANPLVDMIEVETAVPVQPTIEIPVAQVVRNVRKKQVELSDSDLEHLSSGQYSEKVWNDIGRRHGVDPTSREAIPGSAGRGFLMVAKVWPAVESPKGGILTAEGMRYDPTVPIPAAAARSALLSQDASEPINDETSEELI
jgi:hypothetical protein